VQNFRYILRGLVDGSLSITGVIIGAYGGGQYIIISAGIAGAIANGFSNVLAAFSAEQAMLFKDLRSLEASLLINLEDTEKEAEIKQSVRTSAFYDGIATMAGGIFPVSSFFFFEGLTALAASLGITLVFFAAMGIYIGKVTRKSIAVSVIKMTVFAIITAAVCVLVQFVF